ncbi:hypothetical protein [Mycoplasmopsis pullorum]|uniref:Terminase n=1 Tax=Mycoplasmopsis pullorum TaxID=48003 RepID=A0A1L4FSE1_9BACT|nr:hypothetical protein [Mycoplasmopsis pullorum]APJ38509.1 hypothetical protein BLA55_02465 [Mycoplasmopsis pullorum]
MPKIELLEPPIFTEETLYKAVHYTDSDKNPMFEAFKSDSFYEIHTGAKGVSKSFSGAIITIYRLVNEKIFCSVWCRNQYNHIKNTLRPMFSKVLDFLAEVYDLDYRPYIVITETGLYWNYDDGGAGRCVLFQNFEKTQAFQGITLPKNSFRFGELVIDEPIEDPNDSGKTTFQLRELYELQEEKIPLLMANTILRNPAPDGFKLKIKFFYNIFTTDHFLINNFHIHAIPFVNESGQINNDVINELTEKTFIQKDLETFEENLGLIVSMYSKFFIPKKEISNVQLKQFEALKQKNYRLWVITVAGFAFKDPKNQDNFYLRPYIYNESGQLTENIELVSEADFENALLNGTINGIFDGFDPGKSDNASWVRVAIDEDANIWIIDGVEDLKKLFKTKPSRNDINKVLIQLMNESNQRIKEVLNRPMRVINWDFNNTNFNSLVLTDNDIIMEMLNIELERQNNNDISALMAIRKDTKSETFGILNRQEWIKSILLNKLIKVVPTQQTLKLFDNLANQFIPPNEKKRDETVNPKIYDFINAFENACSYIYKIQLFKIYENLERE